MFFSLDTAPTVEVVTLAEAKAHLRVDHGDDDALIAAYLKAAVQHLDGRAGILGLALAPQTWRLAAPRPCSRKIALEPGGVYEIVSVTARDGATTVTLDPSTYRLGRNPLCEFLALNDGASWPSLDAREDALTVVFRAGHRGGSDGPEVPAPIKTAILLLAEHLYGGGRLAEGLPVAVDALLAPYRRRRV